MRAILYTLRTDANEPLYNRIYICRGTEMIYGHMGRKDFRPLAFESLSLSLPPSLSLSLSLSLSHSLTHSLCSDVRQKNVRFVAPLFRALRRAALFYFLMGSHTCILTRTHARACTRIRISMYVYGRSCSAGKGAQRDKPLAEEPGYGHWRRFILTMRNRAIATTNPRNMERLVGA